ncbi:MAG: adenine phosphoribosyltransferase [Pirellulales bacterium]|nr:adenine phosphoribosyltransferase [Pirellulales bacterium]
MPDSTALDLRKYIREIPDFPKPGILFRDITPLLSSPAAFRTAVVELANPFRQAKIDVVAAAEARGFIFAAPIALELNAALVPIRKPGKLPFATITHSYELEYGSDTLQIHTDAIPPGAKVLVVDDLLATGGTVEACAKLVEKAGGRVVACAFLIELGELGGRKKIANYEAVSLVRY